MSQPNRWFLPRAFFPHGGHGGGELPVFPVPPIEREAKASMTRVRLHRENATVTTPDCLTTPANFAGYTHRAELD